VKDWVADITKQRDGEERPLTGFGLESVVIGQDDSGSLIEAPAVVYKSVAEVRGKPQLPEGSAKRAYETLQRLLSKKHGAAAGFGGEHKIRTDEWREEFIAEELERHAEGLSKAKDPEGSADRAFRRALDKLGQLLLMDENEEFCGLAG
jgi:hypothetical protein